MGAADDVRRAADLRRFVFSLPLPARRGEPPLRTEDAGRRARFTSASLSTHVHDVDAMSMRLTRVPTIRAQASADQTFRKPHLAQSQSPLESGASPRSFAAPPARSDARRFASDMVLDSSYKRSWMPAAPCFDVDLRARPRLAR